MRQELAYLSCTRRDARRLRPREGGCVVVVLTAATQRHHPQLPRKTEWIRGAVAGVFSGRDHVARGDERRAELTVPIREHHVGHAIRVPLVHTHPG